MKYILLCLLIIGTTPSFCQGVLILQNKPFVYNAELDSALYRQLEADKIFSKLSNHEKQLFYWTNLFRKDPNWFYDQVINEFIRQFPEINTAELASLKIDIRKSKALPLVFPDKGLLNMSKAHSADLAKRGGIITHKSASGKDFSTRLNEFGQYWCGAENIFSGAPDYLEALIMLLIDYGVANKGHRHNLLDPRFERMGVAFAMINPKKAALVQDFACK